LAGFSPTPGFSSPASSGGFELKCASVAAFVDLTRLQFQEMTRRIGANLVTKIVVARFELVSATRAMAS